MLQFHQLLKLHSSVLHFGHEVFFLHKKVSHDLLSEEGRVPNSLLQSQALQHLLVLKVLSLYDKLAH